MTASPLTILQVGAFPFPLHQGSQVHAAGMCRGLAARGHRVLLATYGHGDGDWPEGVIRAGLPRIPGLAPTASGPHPAKVPLDALLAAKVARVLAREPVDVVHAHNVEAPLAASLGAVLARRRVPLVYEQHTSLEEELPVYLPERWRGSAGRLGAAVDAALPRLADASVALSRRGAERLEARGARRVAYLPPAVDPAELEGGDAARARRAWSLGDRPWVVYTGNADAYQDLDVLFRAMVEVPEAGLLVITGSPLEPLERLGDAVGLPPARLRLVGSRRFSDTLDGIAAATVGAVPRQVCAGFPIKLLNLLGSGRVVVAAAGSAQPIEGVMTVPNGDPVAMAGALRSVVADPSMAQRLGEGARRAVRARWSWAARAKQLERLYRELIDVGT